jgi:hypothetical protein
MNSKTGTSVLAYTSARILIFGITVIVLHLIGVGGIMLLFVSLVISALASYVLLNKQREIIAGKLNARLGKTGARVTDFRGRLAAGAAAEDDDEDEDKI